jgi:pyruvate/2-oxoglutarate dehydrogenase complex dihydrolipoamide acyltransferase (E2) component
MQGGCFSISSLGGIGGTAFTPIINAPEVAILGVSKSQMKPVWNGQEFAPRLMLPLSLSYDHRVIDGAAAARFTAYLAQVLATCAGCWSDPPQHDRPGKEPRLATQIEIKVPTSAAARTCR